MPFAGSPTGSHLASFLMQPRTICIGNGATHSDLDPLTINTDVTTRII